VTIPGVTNLGITCEKTSSTSGKVMDYYMYIHKERRRSSERDTTSSDINKLAIRTYSSTIILRDQGATCLAVYESIRMEGGEGIIGIWVMPVRKGPPWIASCIKFLAVGYVFGTLRGLWFLECSALPHYPVRARIPLLVPKRVEISVCMMQLIECGVVACLDMRSACGLNDRLRMRTHVTRTCHIYVAVMTGRCFLLRLNLVDPAGRRDLALGELYLKKYAVIYPTWNCPPRPPAFLTCREQS
jgi:hypothetical protein